MGIAAEHLIGIGEYGLGTVGKYYFRLGAFFLDKLSVIADIVHAGEGVERGSEVPAELRNGQHVLIRVYSAVVQRIDIHKMVAHLIGGVAQLHHYLPGSPGDAAEANGEPVAAEYGEYQAYGIAAKLAADVLGDGVDCGIVACGAGNDGFGHGYHVTVPEGKALLLRGAEHAVAYDGYDIVALPNNGGLDAAGNGCHM